MNKRKFLSRLVVSILGTMLGLNLSIFIGTMKTTPSQGLTAVAAFILLVAFFKGEVVRNTIMFLTAMLMGIGIGVTTQISSSILLIASTVCICIVAITILVLSGIIFNNERNSQKWEKLHWSHKGALKKKKEWKISLFFCISKTPRLSWGSVEL